MKWRKLYKEAVEGVNIKKLLKQNGVTKLPSGMSSRRDGLLEWRKEHGYAGEKTIERMRKQVEDAGWKRGREMDDAHPDGSWVARGDVYVSPDGRIEMSYYSYYGATSYDNSFSITFKLVGGQVNEADEESEEEEPKFDIGDKVWYKSIEVTIIDMKPSIKGGFRYQIKETFRPNSTVSCWRSGEEIFATKEESEEYERKKEEAHRKRLEDDERRWQEHLWATAAHSPADHYGVQRSYGSPNYTGD